MTAPYPRRGMPYTFRVQLTERAFQALLKAAPKGKRITARLATAELDPRRRGRPVYLFESSRPDALLLRAPALAHAPEAIKAIDAALHSGA